MHDHPFPSGNRNHGDEPIAIVGASCRLPGEATSLEALWDMMRNCRTAHGRIPGDRWDADAWYHPDPDRRGALATKSGFFLEQDVATFDAPFFSVTPSEASGMDPAKRLLLEVTYEALENAGMPMSSVAGTQTGVYVGCMTSDYEDLSTHNVYDLPHMTAAGISEAMTANRVSWFFDFRGPSLTLDTACSSSLYALHLACQSLKLGETNMNIVAGVNLILHPNAMSQLTAMHMLSPDGISHTFDHRANGYGRGEGVSALVVKRLSDAIRDGDMVRCVIRNTAINVDGKTPSVTMPSAEAQSELIRTAYKVADLPLGDTRYVELHGTGTPIGDPIELAAIASTFGAAAPADRPVYIGSIKPNIGHTEGCAGLAGVFRAMLSLEKGLVLPTAGIEQINPKLDLAKWNLALARGVIPWPSSSLRRASISSFGFGGANAHVILDDAYHYLEENQLVGMHITEKPLQSETESTIQKQANGDHSAENPLKLLIFSSRDQEGIGRLQESYLTHCNLGETDQGKTRKPASDYVANMAYTLATKRTVFDHRSFAVAGSLETLAQRLQRGLPKFPRPSRPGGVIFVFTGQGAQWAGMGKELLVFPVFADSIQSSSKHLKTLGCSFDLLEMLQGSHSGDIDSPEYSQPICTSVQVALVELLRDWNIRPKAVVGHSSGEIAAAFAAGIISADDSIKVAYFRGVFSLKVKLSTRCGAMLAAGISETDAATFLEEEKESGIAVTACINSPRSVTLSGDVKSITQLAKNISSAGHFARMLRVSTAYHSPHMQDVADECLQSMVEAGMSEPIETQTLMFSSVTGKLIKHVEIDSSYWIRNMCQPVQFANALHSALVYSEEQGKGLRSMTSRITKIKWNSIIELGPHSALKAPITQIMENVDPQLPKDLPYLSMLIRGEDAMMASLSAAGILWALGNPVALDMVNRETDLTVKPWTLADLPAYPWNHQRKYWHESKSTKSERLKTLPRSDLLGIPVDNQNPLEPQWKNYLRIAENPWITDHMITGTTLYPGAGMLIMVIEAAHQMAKQHGLKIFGIEFRNVHFERGLVVPNDGSIEVSLSIKLPASSTESFHSFTVFSSPLQADWTRHSHGEFSIIYASNGAQRVGRDLIAFEWNQRLDVFEKLKKLPAADSDVSKLYEDLYAAGMEYGDTFQNLTSLKVATNGDFCYGTVKIPDTAQVMPHGFEFPHIIHPATLDAIFHLMVAAVSNGAKWKEAAVPYKLEKMYIASDLPQGSGALFSGYSERTHRIDGELSADLVVSDETWNEAKIIVDGLVLRQVTAGAVRADSSDEQMSRGDFDKRCAMIDWKLDPGSYVNLNAAVTSIYSPYSPEKLPGIDRLKDWIELECHKQPDINVLLAGYTFSTIDILDELHPLISTSTPYQGSSGLTFIDASGASLDRWSSAVADTESRANIIFQDLGSSSESGPAPCLEDQTFDLIIMQSSPFINLSSWSEIVRPGGRLLLYTESKAQSNTRHPDETSQKYAMTGISLGDSTLMLVPVTRQVVSKHPQVLLLVPENSDAKGKTWALGQELELELQTHDIPVHKATPCEVGGLENYPFVISLLDLRSGGFVSTWTPEEFEFFQSLVTSVKNLMWLTYGAQMLDPSEIGLVTAATTGLLRVLRNELPQIRITHLDLSPQADPTGTLPVRLIQQTWVNTLANDGIDEGECEVAELGNMLYIPRTLQEQSFDYDLALASGKAPAIPTKLSSAGPVQLEPSGVAPIGMTWKPDLDVLGDIGPDEVEVRITHTSMPVGEPWRALGTQSSGTITQVGCNVDGLLNGDPVVLFDTPGCKSHARMRHSLVHKIPEILPKPTAATNMWLYAMASYILSEVVRLERSETILIQDGPSPLGQSLLALSRHIGATIFTTVSTEDDKVKLMDTFDLDESRIIDGDQNPDHWQAYLLHQTSNKGVDVVCTSNSRAASANWIAAHGRVAVIGGQENFILRNHGRNITFSFIDQALMFPDHSVVIQKYLRDVPDLLKRLVTTGGPFPTFHTTKFPVSQLADAAAFIAKSEDKRKGILSIELSEDSEVMVVASHPPQPRPELNGNGRSGNGLLDPRGSYIIAGGLGSLGIRISRLMVQQGAQHIVLLSRTGLSDNHKLTTDIAELVSGGCTIDVVKCDVTQARDVQEVVQTLINQGRHIRGVIQCAMVLRDAIFAGMTYEQWHGAFHPKVTGTWNLHSLLPKDLDFFILLSSVVAVIGNVAQANYAAGNSWMDALALFRRESSALGHSVSSLAQLSAVSLNVGVVTDSDHTVDGTAMAEYLDRFSHMAPVSTTLGELDIGILTCMRGSHENGDAVRPQVIFGMTGALRHQDTWASRPMFSQRMEGKSLANKDTEDDGGVTEALRNTTTLNDAASLVQETMKKMLSPSLGLQPAEITDDRPLYDFGVDSFKAVEFRNRVFRELKSDISVFDILSPRPLAHLATLIASKSQLLLFNHSITDSLE
ncbi:hypothetical protein SCAR479_08267 [Seiridium cardinale]|uniref:Polyketide synthase n=1 Tax=Seiridium cardinale TaxID=138064 RepID=A0ABR2XMF2_9PEZI